MNTLYTSIGFIAAFCTTVAFLPQVLQTLKTRKTSDISLHMYLILTLGIILWLTYGIIKTDWPIILANTITLLLVIPILVLKIKHK